MFEKSIYLLGSIQYIIIFLIYIYGNSEIKKNANTKFEYMLNFNVWSFVIIIITVVVVAVNNVFNT